MKLDKKIMFSFLTAMVISISSLIFVFYTAAKSSMQKRIYEHLKTTAESKASWINYYFAERKGDVSVCNM